MKNSLADLNNILFEQLERLNDDEIMDDTEKAKAEKERAKSIQGIAGTIVNNARIQLDAMKFKEDHLVPTTEMPDVLMNKKPKMIGATNG